MLRKVRCTSRRTLELDCCEGQYDAYRAMAGMRAAIEREQLKKGLRNGCFPRSTFSRLEGLTSVVFRSSLQ